MENSPQQPQPIAADIRPPLRALPLRTNFSWTFAGHFVYAGCQWVMLAVMARLGNPEMVGQFVLGLAVTAPIYMFTNLELSKVQGTDVRQEYTFGDFLGLRLVMTCLALVGTTGIVLISGYRMATAIIIIAVGFSKAVEVISDIFFGLFQRHERMDRVGISLLIKGPVTLVALACGLYFTGSILVGVIWLTVTRLLILFVYDIPNGASVIRSQSFTSTSKPGRGFFRDSVLCPRWHKPIMKRLVWLTLPLGIMVMLSSLDSNIPRFFLERTAGERQLGFFAALAYVKVAGQTVVSALGQSANPRLATYYATGRMARFRSMLLSLVGIGMLLGGVGVLGAWIAGRQFLTLFYGAEYGEHASVFVWIMLSAGILYVESFISYSIIAVRFHRAQSFFSVFVVAATVVASILLIPGRGIGGAAGVLVVMATFRLVGSVLIITYAVRHPQAVSAASSSDELSQDDQITLLSLSEF